MRYSSYSHAVWESSSSERRRHFDSDGTVREGVFSYEDSLHTYYLQHSYRHFI